MDKSAIANPTTKYGDGKAHTRNVVVQRLTAAANVLFLLFLVWLVVSLAGADRAQMVAAFHNPFVALVTALMIVSVCVHMRIGLIEVIDDYVHEPRLKSLSFLLNTGFALVIGIIAVVSLLALAFGG